MSASFQKARSQSTDEERILATRRRISREFVSRKFGDRLPTVLGLVPVRRKGAIAALRPLGEKPLIAYTLDDAIQSQLLDRVVVTSDDQEVLDYVRRYERVVALPRPQDLCRTNMRIEPTVLYVLDELRREDYVPDMVMLLYINAPLRRREHIDAAVDTMLIFEPDSVVSVSEDLGFHYRRGPAGLLPLVPKRELRLEKEALYEENGAVYLSRREVISVDRFLGERIGHVMMTKRESFQIDSEFEFWLVERLLEEKDRPAQVGERR